MLFFFSFLLLGCGAPASPLPTRLPMAAVPVAQAADAEMVSLPQTYTPVSPAARATATETPVPALPATPTSAASPTPTAVFTPAANVVPAFLQTVGPVDAPYLEEPPAITNCDGTGELFRSRFPSEVGGRWRYYHIYLPPCYGQDGRAYPVLYLFHGSIQTDSHWADLGLAQLIDRGIQEGRTPPFIAVMPFNGELGNITSGGERSIEGITVDYLLPFIDETYCTVKAASGRGIGGISRGGYWALMIAFRHPDLFAAVSGHSSHLRFETDPARYNPLATYAEADLSGMRIWLDWGERDFLYAGQQQLHELLKGAGIVHDVHMNGGGHNDRYWAVHLQEYLEWHTVVWSHDRSDYPACESL